ncbi:hypothetical protein ACTJJ0_22510 [Chitinophaga sp. 22321]|uniref:Uncharacterized protein n=1 Tax=Chitinophaga hostae TaxID=2831022 RepID=A0ABS5JAD7_9BACT|nr:hypothetical protein [Chitinophaga hostae]MBS0032175.1 hypothetical protein [Chitinophaga hostae]
MNLIQQFTRFVIRKSFHLSVGIIESCIDTTSSRQQQKHLKQLPPGTLGNDIAVCLEQHQLRLVPGFESHDLKHVLLGFKMTPEDEIRLQAFMIGNGNYTFASFAILLFGVLLLPDCWLIFIKDWRNGRKAVPISIWTIDAYAHYSTASLQQSLYPEINTTIEKIAFMNVFVRWGAFAAIAAGVFGMLFCLPFLFSSSMKDLVGAGFPFLGGAVIAGAGLIALSNLSTAKVKKGLAL